MAIQAFFSSAVRGWGLREDGLPRAVRQQVFPFVGEVHVDGVVPVRTADVLRKGQGQNRRVLAQPPVVRLHARQAGAVDAALLARAYADGLAVLHVADGVGLGVFQGDEGHHHVGFRLGGEAPVFRHQVGQKALVDPVLVPALLEGDAEDVLVLLGGGGVIRVDLDHVVAALFLGP